MLIGTRWFDEYYGIPNIYVRLPAANTRRQGAGKVTADTAAKADAKGKAAAKQVTAPSIKPRKRTKSPIIWGVLVLMG